MISGKSSTYTLKRSVAALCLTYPLTSASYSNFQVSAFTSSKSSPVRLNALSPRNIRDITASICSASNQNSIPLKMSSIENEDNKDRQRNDDALTGGSTKKRKDWRDLLPPLPEDHIILSGDMLAIFSYAFLDHFTASALTEESTIATSISSPETSFLVPVWSDVSLHNFGPSLLRAITTEQQSAQIGPAAAATTELISNHYAPCLESAGIASVLLASSWLVAGYFNKTFSFKNTILCSTNRALMVTGKTWLYTAAMMVSLAILSNVFLCGFDSIEGLSKADANFIFDSLSVLAIWRFTVASILNR